MTKIKKTKKSVSVSTHIYIQYKGLVSLQYNVLSQSVYLEE